MRHNTIDGAIYSAVPPLTSHAKDSTPIVQLAGQTRAHRLSIKATFDPFDPHYEATPHTYPVTASNRLSNPAPCTAPQCPARSL